MKALITSKWYLILNAGQPAEFYDRQKDPDCRENLAGRKEVEAEFRDAMNSRDCHRAGCSRGSGSITAILGYR